MFQPRSRRILFNATRALVCALMLAEVGTQANAATAMRAADMAASNVAKSAAAYPFVGDDPVVVRDRVANQHAHAGPPSFGDRVLRLVHLPVGNERSHHDSTDSGLADDFTFVVPVRYGIRYQADKHRLTVNVDLSGDGDQADILIKRTVIGPSGRKLVVAPEARAKGFIQQIDVIELESGKSKKTTVRASVTLSPAAYAETEGEYAIVITGHIVPPYISDRIDHRDPTDDEPTDITTRTSRLYVDISAIWLISAQRSVVLSKALHLSK